MSIVLKDNSVQTDNALNIGGVILKEAVGGYEITTAYGAQTISLTSHFEPGALKIIFADYIGKLHVFDFDDWYGQKDFVSFLDTHYAIKESVPVCVIYFDQTPEEHVVVFYKPTATELGHIVHNQPARTQEVVAMFYPEGASILEAKRLAKTKALNVNLLDSIVALEQQVDVLSRLVITLADVLSNKPEWFDSFKSTIDANSVETLRSIPELIEDFGGFKEDIRKVQAEYFSTRDIPVTPVK